MLKKQQEKQKDNNSDRKTSFATLALLISFMSLSWQIYAWNKFFPLEQANVILSEPTLTEHDNNQLRLELTIKNAGKATAEGVRFTIYEFYDLKVENRCGNDPKNNPRFDDILYGNLGSNSSATIGSIFLNDPTVMNRDIKIEAVLLIKMQYKDVITSNPTIRWSGWHYVLGRENKRAFALVRSDVDKYKDCLKIFSVPNYQN